MSNKRQSVVHNPVIDSPFFQQDAVGVAFNPPNPDAFLLLDTDVFGLLDGEDFNLLE
jgi:hypothetical protein